MSTPIVRRRKKPLPVEARQLLGSSDGQTGRDLADWCGGSVAGTFSEPKVWVPTLEGGLTARVGDWIVKGPREEFWPVKGGIFAETYEDADTPLHGACRTDALTEGARLIEDAACDADWTRTADYCQGLRAGAELLLAKTTEAAAPDARQAARNEAADWFASYPLNAETSDWERGRGDAIAWVCGILRNPDPQRGEQQTEFFQPGRTYLYERLRWKFRCDAVTTHPDTGLRVAVGYSHFGHGKWQTGDLGEGIWAEGGWTDVTEAGDR